MEKKTGLAVASIGFVVVLAILFIVGFIIKIATDDENTGMIFMAVGGGGITLLSLLGAAAADGQVPEENTQVGVKAQ